MRLYYLILHPVLVYYWCTHLDVYPAPTPPDYASKLTESATTSETERAMITTGKGECDEGSKRRCIPTTTTTGEGEGDEGSKRRCIPRQGATILYCWDYFKILNSDNPRWLKEYVHTVAPYVIFL